MNQPLLSGDDLFCLVIVDNDDLDDVAMFCNIPGG